MVTLSRSIVTAGHCVCFQRPEDEQSVYPECRKNLDKNIPIDQIISGRDIFYVVGQQIIDERLRSYDKYGEVLYNLPKAQKAFTYELNYSKKKDIGILIVDIPHWDNQVLHNIVRPLELPDKG